MWGEVRQVLITITPPIIAIIETKTGNILISLDHWRIAGGNSGLIHQENKYWQIIRPRADIMAWPGRPITLNGPKLLFDHKLCELELSWSWSTTRAGLVRKSLVRPPALQYNLPPRWRLIKKVLGDLIRAPVRHSASNISLTGVPPPTTYLYYTPVPQSCLTPTFARLDVGKVRWG